MSNSGSRSQSHNNTSSRTHSSSTNVASSRPTGFDVLRVYESFVNALRDPANAKSPIGTQDYINGYRELIKYKIARQQITVRMSVCLDFVINSVWFLNLSKTKS